MTSNPPRGPGLAIVTALWTALTGAMLVLLSPDVGAGRDVPPRGSAAEAREPPPARGLWERLGSATRAIFLPRPADADREAVAQALESLGALDWHRAGHRGKGVKVGVLDSGFRGYRLALGKVLPGSVATHSCRKDGKLEARPSQHGVLCAEVIHHLAPDAELLLVNWEPESPASFLEAVRRARREGARVLSCSVIMPGWSDGEGGGAVHEDLREALGDALLFASAGNTAQRHWAGPASPDKDGWHQWARGKKDNTLRPFGQERVSVELTCKAGAYELVVLDAAGMHEVGRSRTLPATGFATAVVRFEPVAQHRYVVRLKCLAPGAENGKPAGRFHLTALGGRLQYATPQRSIPFPADGAEVVAVGAVDGKGRRMAYSSCGPCAAAAKPDLAACVPFPSVWRPEQAFSGTSAAAPQAAGAAALVWGRHLEWSAEQVRQALTDAATKPRPGHSTETGYGVVHLPLGPSPKR
jgi:hypothetical protein